MGAETAAISDLSLPTERQGGGPEGGEREGEGESLCRKTQKTKTRQTGGRGEEMEKRSPEEKRKGRGKEEETRQLGGDFRAHGAEIGPRSISTSFHSIPSRVSIVHLVHLGVVFFSIPPDLISIFPSHLRSAVCNPNRRSLSVSRNSRVPPLINFLATLGLASSPVLAGYLCDLFLAFREWGPLSEI